MIFIVFVKMIIMYDYSFYVIVYDISKYEGSLN